jgi:hypothetical protein
LAHFHPHIHALVTEGVFRPESGAFLPLPKLATEPFLKLWEQEMFALLLRDGKITEDVVANIRSWKHSGFSVDQSVRLEAGDAQGRVVLEQEARSKSQTVTPGGGRDGAAGSPADRSASSPRLGGVAQAGLRIGSAPLSQLRVGDEDYCLHRAAPDRGHREDPPALRAVGREFRAGTTGGAREGGGLKEQAGGRSGAPRAKRDGRLGSRVLLA